LSTVILSFLMRERDRTVTVFGFSFQSVDVFVHHNIPGHEIDFENVKILDRADTVRKLEYKEMLYIRKHKQTINKQSEGELFT
jgi:hypothetical protein